MQAKKVLEGISTKVEYADLRFETLDETTIKLVNGEIKEVSSSLKRGGGVRVFKDGAVGFAYASDPDWDKLSKKALNAATLIKGQNFHPKGYGAVKDEVIVNYKEDPRQVPMEEKIQLLRHYYEILSDHEKVVAVQIFYKDYWHEKFFFNTEGSEIKQTFVFSGLYFLVRTQDGSITESIIESIGEWGGFELVRNLDEKAEKALKVAVDLLYAEPVQGGEYAVVMDPELTGVFAHEAFGHLSEADHICENEKLKEIMKIGAEFGSEELNIVDDGTLAPYRGYTPYDDEGIPARKTYLIKNGILVGRLHNRKTAYAMEEELTGNGRAIFSEYEPLVRMTNTFVEPGKYSFEELLERLDNGIYAIDYTGGETEVERFTFTAKYGYEVKNGKIGKMLKNISLSGNVFETLKNITAVGNDLVIHGGMGGCGKGGQSPLPVGTGGPHTLVKKILIG